MKLLSCLIICFAYVQVLPSSAYASDDEWTDVADDEVIKKRKKKKLKQEVINKAERSRRGCGLGNSDGRAYNQKTGVTLKLGPPGAQNGNSNPLGIPPGPQDIDFTFVHRCGYEGSVSLVPGVTFGVRYRYGEFLYGSVGGGLLLTAAAMGPGLYSAIGVSIARIWPVTIEVEFKQAIGIGSRHESGSTQVISPYAFRIGAGFYW